MKFIKKSNIELGDTQVPDLVITNMLDSIEGNDFKLYVYLVFSSKNGLELEKKDISKKTGISESELSFSFDRLEVLGLITKTTQGYYITDIKENEINKLYIPKVEPKKSKVQTELEQKRIAAASAINESFFQGIMSLGWYTDIGSMFEKYNFSGEVMIALFHHSFEKKALNKKYVYAVAENWYKGSVKTFDDLEEYLASYEKVQKTKQKILKVLRYNRNFTEYEEQYIDKWIKEMNFDFDMIEEALKRTVSKANPSINYVNGILLNWYKKGFKVPKDLENDKKESVEKVKSRSLIEDKKTTKYQNYSQRDYADLESYYDNV